MNDEAGGPILTVTPNPSIDFFFEVDRLVWDDANRVHAPRRRPGGQGINAARAARALGGEAVAIALLGGGAGHELEETLRAEGLPLVVVPAPGETRTFFAVHERSTGRQLLINPRGPDCGPAVAGELMEAAVRSIDQFRPSWVVCSGSVPPGLPPDLYARIGRHARDVGCRFVPDCDLPLLAPAAAACDLLVPNRHEAARLLGTEIATTDAALDAAGALLDRFEPELAIITLGAEGAVLAHRTGRWIAHAEQHTTAGVAVGAGDAFLASLLLALDEAANPAEALRRAVAAGAAAIRARGAEVIAATHYDEALRAAQSRPMN